MYKIIEYTDDTPPRKRACINCGHREVYNAGSKCNIDGHYIGYVDTWDDWCRRWCKNKKMEAMGDEPNG